MPREFYYEHDWYTYNNLVKGARNKFEYDNLLDRQMLTLTYNVNRGKRAAMTPEKVLPFGIDKQKSETRADKLSSMSEEEFAEHKRKLIKRYGLSDKLKVDG